MAGRIARDRCRPHWLAEEAKARTTPTVGRTNQGQRPAHPGGALAFQQVPPCGPAPRAHSVNTRLFTVRRWANGYPSKDPAYLAKTCCFMLLTDCRPGAVVQYRRPPFTFRAIVVRTTPRGNVVLCAMRRDGYRIDPLFLSVPPARVERPADGPQPVEQTAPDPGALVPARVQVERGCKSQVPGATV